MSTTCSTSWVVDTSASNEANAAVRGLAQIGGVENFWSQARRNLRKYNGIPPHHFHLFLKECEWRFNYGSPRQLSETLVRWLAEQT